MRQREARVYNRKLNRDRLTVNGQFTRARACKKLGCNNKGITRFET
jgi:hypothetical protein